MSCTHLHERINELLGSRSDYLVTAASAITGSRVVWTDSWSGWDCVALREASGLIFRIPVNPEADKKLRDEAHFLRLVGTIDMVALPKVRYLETPGGVIAWHREIVGRPLHEIGEAPADLRALENIFPKVELFIAKTREISVARATALGLQRRRDLQARARALQHSSGLSNREEACLARILLDLPMPGPMVAAHFDLNPTNIIFDRAANSIGVIDFLDAGIGEVADDISKLFKTHIDWPKRITGAQGLYPRVCAFALVEALEDRADVRTVRRDSDYLELVMAGLQ